MRLTDFILTRRQFFNEGSEGVQIGVGRVRINYGEEFGTGGSSFLLSDGENLEEKF